MFLHLKGTILFFLKVNFHYQVDFIVRQLSLKSLTTQLLLYCYDHYSRPYTQRPSGAPLWSRSNIVAFHLTGLVSIPGRVSFPGWSFSEFFFLNSKTNVGKT